MTYRLKINDEDLQALVDGELPPEIAAYLRHLIEMDQAIKERYETLLHQNALLKLWYKKSLSGTDI
jgi:anti-sigma factor RsiW